MNENPGETPMRAVPPAPVEPMAPTSVQPVAPVPEPVAPTPEPQPVVMPTQPEAPKKKTGLIVAIIALVVTVIACAGVAIWALNPFGKGTDDRVPKALAGLFAEGAPTNVAMDGVVSLYSNPDKVVSPILGVTIDFNTELNTVSSANNTKAKITVIFADESELSFNADEIHTEDGNLYLKLSGIPEAIEKYRKENPSLIEDCATEDEDCMIEGDEEATIETYFTMLESLGILDVIDNEWIYIPSTSFSNVTELAELDAPTQCLIDAFGTVGEYTDDVASSYTDNPFITYSTENLTLEKKKNNLYRIGVDTDKFTGFVNAMSNSGFVNELNACMSEVAVNDDVETEDLVGVIEALPVIYVEVDENNKFTRIYLKADNSDETMTATADIDLSYPDTITVSEPSEYIDLSQVLSGVLNYFYEGIIPE